MTNAWQKFKYCLLLSLLFVSICASAWAHNPGQSMVVLNLQDSALLGEIHIYYDDLKLFIPEIPIQNEEINLDTLQPLAPTIQNFFQENISIQSSEAIPLNLKISPVFRIDPNRNLIMDFQSELENPNYGSLKIFQAALFKKAPQFSTLVVLKTNQVQRTAILTKNKNSAELFTTTYSEFLGFLKYGMQHIYFGLDHVFFLLLLIFSPFVHSPNRKETRSFREIFWNIIKLATAFTISHSFTLCMAVLKICYLPTQFVETIILLSIIIVGINKFLYREIPHEWLVVFMFGLFHGYGFSTVLNEVGLSREHLVVPLVGFNLGVEIGQILIIFAALFPLYFIYSRWSGTTRFIRFCCGIIALISTIWLIARIVKFF